jgi:hypothetical protein
MNSWINLHALWRIVVVGLLTGAGLPALFAVGLRLLSLPAGRTKVATTGATEDRVYGGNPAAMAVALLCFLVVLAGIAWGIYMVVNS